MEGGTRKRKSGRARWAAPSGRAGGGASAARGPGPFSPSPSSPGPGSGAVRRRGGATGAALVGALGAGQRVRRPGSF